MSLLGTLTQVVSLLVGLTSDPSPQTGLPPNPIPQPSLPPDPIPQASLPSIQIPQANDAFPDHMTQITFSSTREPQTAEELFETLRVEFTKAAILNNIDITSVSYDNFEELHYQGPEYVESFDFVIVGAGAAGSVLVNRLSEIQKFKILLLEAGGVCDFMTELPGLVGLQQFGNDNWDYFTEVQPNMGLGLKNQRMHLSLGKGLGGSSLTNYMEYARGSKIDYDTWAAMGNPGWSYDDVLPYFKKSEDSRVKLVDIPCRHRGGELTVEDVAYRSVSARAFKEACSSLGYPYIDYNGANQLGVSFIQANTRDGLRCSAEKAFLRPARYRPNLTIRTNSFVTRILIDDKNVAYAVEYMRNGIKRTVSASKEVILSAGSIKSAQLLMLSGVGPRSHLTKLGLPVKKDLPVGQKFYDMLSYIGLAFKVRPEVGINVRNWCDPASFVELHKYARGPLTSTGGVEAVVYLKTNASTNNPGIELKFLGIGVSSDNGITLARFLDVAVEYYNVMFKPLEKQSIITIVPTLLHPKSHGYIKLRSTSPFDQPKLYGNYFAEDEDLKTLIAGIREAQRIVKTPAFQQLQAVQSTAIVPGCEKFEFDSDEYLECALRSLTVSNFEYVGTCKMGPASDPEAVVDARLRVHGIKNLRVIDTSVIPTPISGYRSAPAYLVAEKGADIVKQDWWRFI